MSTGLFFGSFNPIHIGHLVIANYMVQFAGLKEVWFVVSPHNPFKEKSSLLNDTHRLQLVRVAIEDYPQFKASDIEFKLSQPSYTIHTLTHLQEKYPDVNFSLIMGADNVEHLHKWKNYEQILAKHEVFVYPRQHNAGSLPEVLNAYAGKIHFTQAPVMEVSSTFIREAIRMKKDVSFMLPPNVYEYVKEMHFYEK
jgi:nicotinate-nucleotide adenylyltransferase